MRALALLSFLLLPLAEIAVFVCVGSAIGVFATLGLVLLAGIAGIAILRLQGLATLRRVRTALDRGEVPGAALFDGACLVFAGLLLIIPGFLTDAVALLLLIPPLRATLRGWMARRLQVKTARSATGGAAG